MSQLFGQDSSHIQKQNVMKEEFGWEIPVELVPLPSQGLLYPPESPLYKKKAVKIKSMTARDEDILTSQALIKEGTVVSHLLRSCIVEKGFDVDDMLVGDRNAVLMAIRITGYGPDYHITPQCTACSTTNDIAVDLAGMPIKSLGIKPAEKGKNLFEFILPVTKKKVVFRYSTANSEREKQKRSSNYRKHVDVLIDNIMTSTIESAIVSIDGVTDRNKIYHFVMNMPAFDSRSLRKYMNSNEPGMDMKHIFECKSCGHTNDIMVPITTNFFWPGT